MTIKTEILSIVAEQPGLSAREIAECLARDPRNTRRDVAELKEGGELIACKDELGVNRYYSSNHQAGTISGKSGPVIDADFREIPAASSDSRALVVYGAAQPADNRMAATLAAADKARRRQGGVHLPAQYATSLNALYELDPDGNQTMTMLALAEVENAQRQLAREQQEAASRAIAVQAREPTASEIWGALGRSAIWLFDTMQNNARERAWSDYHATDTRQPDAVEPLVDRWEQRQKRTQTEEAARRLKPNAVRELLAKAKPTREEPPAESWWLKHLGTPKKPVWR